MDKALYDRGMAMRRKVLGDEYVDRAIANTDDFNRKFQDLLNEFCWGAVWTDEDLKPRDRSLLNLGMIACLGRMQCRVYDAGLVETDHQINIVGRRAGFARDERWIAVKCDACGGNGAFGLRRGHDRFDVAGKRRLNRPTCACQRSAAVGGIDGADFYGGTAAITSFQKTDCPVGPSCFRRFPGDVKTWR